MNVLHNMLKCVEFFENAFGEGFAISLTPHPTLEAAAILTVLAFVGDDDHTVQIEHKIVLTYNEDIDHSSWAQEAVIEIRQQIRSLRNGEAE